MLQREVQKERPFWSERIDIKNVLTTPHLDICHRCVSGEPRHGGGAWKMLGPRANHLEVSPAASQEGGVPTPSNSAIGKRQGDQASPPAGLHSLQVPGSTQGLLDSFLGAGVGSENAQPPGNDDPLPQQRRSRSHGRSFRLSPYRKPLTSPPLFFTLSNNPTLRTK